eukprot:COSAG05_NODE_1054_length_6012_cov_63.809572_3_plen_156_part_00
MAVPVLATIRIVIERIDHPAASLVSGLLRPRSESRYTSEGGGFGGDGGGGGALGGLGSAFAMLATGRYANACSLTASAVPVTRRCLPTLNLGISLVNRELTTAPLLRVCHCSQPAFSRVDYATVASAGACEVLQRLLVARISASRGGQQPGGRRR